MEKIEIALACDERYMPGLLGTVASILVGADASSSFVFHILDGGIKEESVTQLNSILAEFASEAAVHLIKIDTDAFRLFPSFFYESKMTYARILLPMLLSTEKVIYIDTDILVLKNITKLWQTELTTHAAVCLETVIGTIKNDCPLYQQLGLDGDAPYFNAGLMVMNLKKFREDKIAEKTFDYLQKNNSYCKFWDQSALNVTLYNKLTWLDNTWNVQAHKEVYHPAKDLQLLKSFTINFHFVTSKKPWLSFGTQPEYQMFYTLLDTIGYPLTEPSFFSKKQAYINKIKLVGVLPGYYRLRSMIYKAIGNTKAAAKNKAVASHWAYIKEVNKKLSNRQQETEMFLQSWRKKIQSKRIANEKA